MTKLYFIGTGSCLPEKYHFYTSFLLEHNSKYVLFDIGPGSLVKLNQMDFDIFKITDIFITHVHTDHLGDLFPFLFSLKIHARNVSVTHTVNIYISENSREILDSLLNSYSKITELEHFKINYLHPYEKISIHGLNIDCVQVNHHITSLGFKIKFNDKYLSITGDTGVCSNFDYLFKNTNYAITECTFENLPENKTMHLDIKTLSELLFKFNPKTVFVTHIYPHQNKEKIKNEIMKIYKGTLIFPEDGQKYNLD